MCFYFLLLLLTEYDDVDEAGLDLTESEHMEERIMQKLGFLTRSIDHRFDKLEQKVADVGRSTRLIINTFPLPNQIAVSPTTSIQQAVSQPTQQQPMNGSQQLQQQPMNRSQQLQQ